MTIEYYVGETPHNRDAACRNTATSSFLLDAIPAAAIHNSEGLRASGVPARSAPTAPMYD
jgi:hypothetical protein